MSCVSRASTFVAASPCPCVVTLTCVIALALVATGAQAQSTGPAPAAPAAPAAPSAALGQASSPDSAPAKVLAPDADAVDAATTTPAAGDATAAFVGTVSSQLPATLSATDAFTDFRQRFDNGNYVEAVPYAQRVLELAEKDATTPDAEEVQVALMNLATTQYLAEDYVGAESGYQRVIDLVEASGRPLHARLTRAYAGLASAYHDSDRHELAVANFDTAVGLTRRHEGLLSDQQVPLLEKYIDSLTKLGRHQDALKGQRYILRVAVRKYGENSPQLAPTLENIGRWYSRVGAYDQARRIVKRAIELVEAGDGPNSLKLLGPLVTLATCDRKQLLDPTQQLLTEQDPDRAAMFTEPGVILPSYSPAMLVTEAEKALLRAVSIAEGRPDPSLPQVAHLRTQLGDWYQGRGQADRALPNYRTAWIAASQAKDQKFEGKPLREALFGEPLLLQLVRPDGWNKYSERPPEQVETRNVQLEFVVSARGTVEAPKVLDDAGDPKRAERTIDALKDTARYRPRMAEGEPVATTGVTFSQPWIVLLPTAPDSPTSKGAPAAARPRASEPRPADNRTPPASPNAG